MVNERLYIAYGSNLNLEQMKYRCPTARVIDKSNIEDYELVFRGGKRGAVATVEPCIGQNVPVLVWSLKPQDEKALDHYEGYPSFYRKEMMDIPLGNKTISAMVYVMNEGHEYGLPSSFYLNTIKQGYHSAGFDTDYLTEAVIKTLEYAEQEQQYKQNYEQDYDEEQGSLFNMYW